MVFNSVAQTNQKDSDVVLNDSQISSSNSTNPLLIPGDYLIASNHFFTNKDPQEVLSKIKEVLLLFGIEYSTKSQYELHGMLDGYEGKIPFEVSVFSTKDSSYKHQGLYAIEFHRLTDGVVSFSEFYIQAKKLLSIFI